MAGGVCVLLGMVPGMPLAAFFAVGLSLLGLGFWRARRELDRFQAGAEPDTSARTSGDPWVTPWALRARPECFAWLAEGDRSGAPRALAEAMAERLFQRLGVLVPRAALLTTSDGDPRTLVIEIDEREAVRFSFVDETPKTARASLLAGGTRLLEARASTWLGLAETRELLRRLERHVPAAVRETVPDRIRMPTLTDVLRRLVDERVSIRNLKTILEAIAYHEGDRRPGTLVEVARRSLKSALSAELAPDGTLEPLLLDPEIEHTLRARITPEGTLHLAPAARRDIVLGVRQALGELPPQQHPLLTAPDLRPHVRQLLAADLPELPVTCAEELWPGLAIAPVGTAVPFGA
jgi:type III secretion protein V